MRAKHIFCFIFILKCYCYIRDNNNYNCRAIMSEKREDEASDGKNNVIVKIGMVGDAQVKQCFRFFVTTK